MTIYNAIDLCAVWANENINLKKNNELKTYVIGKNMTDCPKCGSITSHVLLKELGGECPECFKNRFEKEVKIHRDVESFKEVILRKFGTRGFNRKDFDIHDMLSIWNEAQENKE